MLPSYRAHARLCPATAPFALPQLDLDEFDMEQSLMEQIESDTAVMGMISEMFFEQHYNDFDVSAGVPLPVCWTILMTCKGQEQNVCALVPQRVLVGREGLR